jgi:amino-acid N-acetyltransferase
MNVTVRPARVGDVQAMAAIINDYAEQGKMLHRSHADLYESLRDFQVAEMDGRVVGICGLRIMWSNLAECYALAVANEARGHGVGKRLVLSTVDEAEQLGIRRVFALTYEQQFFERCGFRVVDRHQELPLKVWGECARCPKNQACDEIAVVRDLDVPDLAANDARPVNAHYDVPILSEVMVKLEQSAAKK